MQNMRKRLLFSTLAGLTLCVTMTARMTSAQGPGGQGQRGQGGGQGNQRQNFQGQGGRGGGQMAFAMGTITSGDANARTITIQSQFGGNAQTIQLGTTTQLVTQTSVTVADLKVNDQVQVQGMPTGITASSLTVGQMPTFLQGGGRGGPGGGQGGNGGQNGAQNANGTAQELTARTASASATGRVVSLNPLTLAINNDVTITIKMASNARVTKITPLTFSGLKVGDRVMASGQAATDGSFTATGVAINMTMGGPGGGQGGPGGGFGPGGPGGGGPGGPGGGGPGGPGGGPGGDPPPGE